MDKKLRLGVIGLGGRAASLLGVFRRVHSGLRVAAVADLDRDGALRRLRDAELPERDTAFFTDADEMLGHAGDLDALLGVPTAVSAMMIRRAYGGEMPHGPAALGLRPGANVSRKPRGRGA